MCESENNADSDPYPDASGEPYRALLIHAMKRQPGSVPAIIRMTAVKADLVAPAADLKVGTTSVTVRLEPDTTY